jgi:hypothetical protein
VHDKLLTVVLYVFAINPLMMKFGPPNLCFIDTNNSEKRIQIMKIPSIQHSSVVYYIEDDCILGSYAV